MTHHAPPPGSRTGVADYAETLRQFMSRLPAPAVNLYHLGNNGLHAAIYQKALREPGVIVLHDAVLQHFFLGTLTCEQYLEEFVFNYGEWRRDLGSELWDERRNSGIDPRYFHFPMLKRVVETARAVIVHNPGAAALARAHGAKNIHTIPHFYVDTPQPDHFETARFRQQIGAGQGSTLFGIFGYLRETKRLLPCIRAFLQLHAARPNTALLIAGDPVSPDLRRLLDSEADHPAIHRLGHLTEAQLLTAAASVDACLNLRYPAAGETSGIAIRLMGFAKPVILTDCEENSAFPAAACLRVARGVSEAAELFDQMSLVTDFPQFARDVGVAARAHILDYHNPEACALAYSRVLQGPYAPASL